VEALTLAAGQFCLLPAELDKTELFAKSDTCLLCVEAK
jgi:hypothetical protein